MKTYTVRYVHKISPRATDTSQVDLPDSCFSDRRTLASALRNNGILASNARIREMRVEGNEVVIFPTLPGLTAYWHSVILTPIAGSSEGHKA